MGLRLTVALAVVAGAAAASPTAFIEAHRQPDGGFAEPGGRSSPALTSWAVLALRSAGREIPRPTRDYLRATSLQDVGEKALVALALADPALAAELEAARRPDGRIGPFVNSTAWSVLALRAVGRPAGAATVRYLLGRQRPGGGWSWHPRSAPDSNDTAAVMQALRAAGVRGRPLRRGAAYLRRLQNRDGGFALVSGRPSDAQSTAWAIQALVAAGQEPGRAAFRYLARMRRRDGSYRYSARYSVTPVWVTAQVVPALARKPFPLR